MNTPLSTLQCRERLRTAMPIAPRVAYFDHAAVAPLSAPAAEQIRRYTADFGQQGDLVWPEYARQIEVARQVAAEAFNAKSAEMGWVANTTQGIGFVAEGLDWRAGDNLVTLKNEFPSNLFPWLNLASRGVETRLAPVDTDGTWTTGDLLNLCDSSTRLISVSWVGFASGYRGPIHELVAAAHQRGILVMLDAIQAVGVFPLDVRETPVDFLAADGHKWMLGPEGAGIFYVAENALNQLRPLNVGWNSVVDRYNFRDAAFRPREATARYEGGTQNVVGVTALGASLQLLTDCGWGPRRSTIGDTVLENTSLLADRLKSIGADIHSPIEPDIASGIVSFTPPTGDPTEIRQRCADQLVVLSCRNQRLRAAPHAYTNEEDIERLVEAVGRKQ